MGRIEVGEAKRVVVKVGSSSISGENSWRIAPLVGALAAARRRGAEVVLVSSGAIATGMPFLKLEERPTDLATQQAAAAVGQSLLVHRYQTALEPYSIVAGQVLLTASDMENATHRGNARRAMERLIDLRILPIVNENDTVATHEIRFGDNDRLAALVAELIDADALVLLSDVDAIYTKPPQFDGAEPIDRVPFGDALDGVEITATGASGVGSGGAQTKVSAARHAAAAGVAVVVTSIELVGDALGGGLVGTFFEPAARVRS